MLRFLGFMLKRDLNLYYRSLGETVIPFLFFALIASVFSILLSADLATLTRIAPMVIWVSVVLSILLSLESIFRIDFQEGILEQYLLSSHPLYAIVLLKGIAHCLAIACPLIVLGPFVGLMMGMPIREVVSLLQSLSVGLPMITFIGLVGALLTIGLPRGGVLISLLLLPMVVPIILLGVGHVLSVRYGIDNDAYLFVLAALLSLTLGFAPLLSSLTLKVSLESC